MRRGHANVHDRHVGPVIGHSLDQRLAVGDRSHDLMAPVLQQPGDALPHDGGVLRDDDPHRAQARRGNSTVTTVGPPGGLDT